MSISPTSRSARLHLGAAYYPEHWAEDHWTNDIRLMREAGLRGQTLKEQLKLEPYGVAILTQHSW